MKLKKTGNTGEILQLLERRLDNVIYKLNFAPSRKAAREVITHGHIYVNGHKVDVTRYLLKIGDKISVKKFGQEYKKIKEQLKVIRISRLKAGCSLIPINQRQLLLHCRPEKMFRFLSKSSWLSNSVRDKN